MGTSFSKAELEIVAYHEAGHAVMALACGFSLSELRVDIAGTGFVAFNPHDDARPEEQIAKLVALVYASGLAAEMVHAKKAGRADSDDDFIGNFEDQSDARRWIEASNGVEVFYDYLMLSFMFLEENWKFVEMIAETLIAVRKLNGGSLSKDSFPRLFDNWHIRLQAIVLQRSSDPSRMFES